MPALYRLLISFFLTSAAFAQTSAPAGYQLIWQDEFEGTALDTTKWGMPSYKKREAATINSEGTLVIAEGVLKLRALEKDGEICCAIIDTRHKFEHTYGWYEARMKMHRHTGVHSCFWLQTSTFKAFPGSPAQSGTEMDIMEWFGPNRRSGWAGMNVYFFGEKGSVRSPSIPQFHLMGGPVEGDRSSPLADMSQDFHLYALHWTPKACLFYCDGIEIMRETKAISAVPQYIVLSLLCSHWERSRLDLAKLPDALEVDYVRVYAPRDEAPAQPPSLTTSNRP